MANKKSTKPKTDDAKDSGGNSISVGGNVSGSNIVMGNHNTVTQSVNTQANEIANYFEVIYRQIETRQEDPQVDKEEIVETVQRIEQETAKGEEANPAKVDRWLSTLSDMAPDIGEVVLSTLTNPAAGIATVIRKIAEKAKEASQK
jgi:hypothetical protein